MINMPYLGYICMEAVVFFHVYFILWDVNLVPAAVNFTNLEAMQTLGNIDSIVCSKSAFISERGNRSIAAFKIGNTICENDGEKKDNIEANKTNDVDSMDSSIGSIDLNKDELDYIPNQVKDDEIFRSKTVEQLEETNHVDHSAF